MTKKSTKKPSKKTTRKSAAKKYILRGYRSGVTYCAIEKMDAEYIYCFDSRIVWYWRGAATLAELAVYGPADPSACKITVRKRERILRSDVSTIIECQPDAIAVIDAIPEWRVGS